MKLVEMTEVEPGVFVPKNVARAQRRKQRILENEAKKKRHQRNELIGGLLLAAALIAYLVGDFMLFRWAITHR